MPTAAHLRLFHRLVKLHPAVVCPPEPVPAPSVWAAAALGLSLAPSAATVLDSHALRLAACASSHCETSLLAAAKALHTAAFHPESEVILITASAGAAARLLAALSHLATRLGLPRRRVSRAPHSLLLSNRSRILVFAGPPHSRRRFRPTIIIVDDAARVEDRVPAAFASAIARHGTALWLLSTPHRPAGLFFNVWHGKGIATWLRLPLDVPAIAADRLLDAERTDQMIDPSIPCVPLPDLLGGRP